MLFHRNLVSVPLKVDPVLVFVVQQLGNGGFVDHLFLDVLLIFSLTILILKWMDGLEVQSPHIASENTSHRQIGVYDDDVVHVLLPAKHKL
jgi:uncharacterized membrane protein